MPDNQPRVFQALDGTELKSIIKSEIAKALDANSKFARHLTYPLVSFAFSVVVSAYPMDPPEFKVDGKARYERAAVPDGVEPEVISTRGELNIDAPADGGLAPDEARESAGLPVTSPTRVPLGRGGSTTVDAAPTGSALPVSVEPEPEGAAALASGQAMPSQMKRLAAQRSGGGGGAAEPAKPTPVTNATAPRNRAGASPSFARSVDLRTKVNPDGVKIDTNIKGD